MEVGDTITFPFGKGEKEGIIYKIFPTTVYIKSDFPKHKGKIIKRSIMDVQPTKEGKKIREEKKKVLKKKETKTKAKQKIKSPKEARKKEKVVKKSTK
jgi:hypothetical protein